MNYIQFKASQAKADKICEGAQRIARTPAHGCNKSNCSGYGRGRTMSEAPDPDQPQAVGGGTANT
jgi:hypothetical protein